MINRHTIVVIVLAALLYFWQPQFAKFFLLASAAFNIYLRLLTFNFMSLLNKQAKSPLLILISVCRVFLIGAFLAILIIKYDCDLFAILLAFIVYKVVLLNSGSWSRP